MPTLRSSVSSERNHRGFTLLEIVVVMGIMAVLSSLMLGYSQRNSKQVLLATTQAKMASVFSRAKFLSLQSFFSTNSSVGDDEFICAHGVEVDFDEQRISIFQSISDECAGPENLSDTNYIDEYLDYEKVYLEGELNRLHLSEQRGVELVGEGQYTVIFIPPEPRVKFSDNVTDDILKVEAKTTVDDTFILGVTVDKNGQIQVN